MEDENKKQWYQPMEPDSDREETLDLFEEAGLYELKDNGELLRAVSYTHLTLPTNIRV